MNRHIIFVDETANLGGGETNLLTFIAALKQRGWHPSVVLPTPGPFSRRLQEDGIPVYFVPRPRLISTTLELGPGHRFPNPFGLLVSLAAVSIWTLRLHRLFSRSRPQLVHTISMWAHVAGGLAARFSRLPVAWHFQDIVHPHAGWGLYRRLLIAAARLIPHRIICISEQVAAHFRSDPVIQQRIDLLWNTIDLYRFSPKGHAQNNSGNCLHIGTVARLMPWKGQHVALQVARRLKSAGVPFRWTFAGDATLGHEGYRRHLQKLVRDWNLSPEVQFVGWLDEVATLYHRLDVLVHLPTDPEPFGLVLAEAMAAGVPVICSRGGADPLVRQSGGELVPPRQIDPVFDILSHWAQTPSELKNRSASAHSYAAATFSVDAYTDKLTAIYERLLAAIH